MTINLGNIKAPAERLLDWGPELAAIKQLQEILAEQDKRKKHGL
jgi:hypothetical protein